MAGVDGIGLGIVLLSILVSVGVPLGLGWMASRRREKEAAAEQELLATGAAAAARILSIAETGMYVDDRPQVRLVLEVSPEDGPTYEATVNKAVSLLHIPRIQPGLLVDVRYDRADPTRLALVGL